MNNDEKTQTTSVSSTSSFTCRASIIQSCTRQTLESFTKDELKNISNVTSTIINECNLEIELVNGSLPKGMKMSKLENLIPSQVADIMSKIYNIAVITVGDNQVTNDPDKSLLGIYQTDGPLEGTYQTADYFFDTIIHKIAYQLEEKRFSSVRRLLRLQSEIRRTCSNKDLIAVNNGIFDYRQKKLLQFNPKFIFLSKSLVDYNDQAQNIVLHNDDDNTDWDVEHWMDELSDDPEVVKLLWQILGAIIRPNVHWDMSAWFYSERGNNGKGTLCELMRQLCGEGTQVSLSLREMGEEFKLEPLLHASAIITDENDVGTYIDKAANLKAIVTGDAIQINRKFQIPVTFAFHGFMVQCLNEMPKIKDKSDSFFRRQLFIPFTKCFTGKERKYIKHDYLKRTEVLEYVLYKVLHMNYYELDVPDSCKKALDEYKEYVDPVRAFLKEMMPQFVWELLPWTFLYDLYCAWYRRNNQGTSGGMMGSASFIKDVRRIVGDLYGDDWAVTKNTMRPGNRMVTPEPLIEEYDLQNWMNPMYLNSKDVDKKCVPELKNNYRGLYRIGQTVTVSVPGDIS